MADSIVWISGASAGIGAALAEAVPFEDATVIDISRSGSDAQRVDEHVTADLADPASWQALESHFATRLDGFTGERAVFVHNAGVIDPVGFAGEVDSPGYRNQVLLNAAAPQTLGHAFLAALRESGFAGRADLVMLTSGAASKPYEGWSAYCAGKAAVEMWVRVAGAEQVRRGRACRVVAVAPGVIATRMQQQLRAADETDFPAVGKFHDLHARGQLTDPADAAAKMWGLLERDLDNGAVVDLRHL